MNSGDELEGDCGVSIVKVTSRSYLLPLGNVMVRAYGSWHIPLKAL